MNTTVQSIRLSYFKLFFSYALIFTSLSGLFCSSDTKASSLRCKELFYDSTAAHRVISPATVGSKVTAPELLSYVSQSITKTQEFDFIRTEARKLGVRVWMFGGTASSYLHYAKWDLARQKGILNLQADRFDYDFTNIFRSTQDLDIVVDGTMEQVLKLQTILQERFPYFTGSVKSWEVRSLRHSQGNPKGGFYKEALLDDPNFSNQNTDTNSLAMVEITESKDPIVRDLRAWTTGKNQFLDDSINNKISYLRNPLHHTTARAQRGENPEILSVIRLLTKAFQYDLSIDPKSMSDIKEVIANFHPNSVTNQWALFQLNKSASKLIIHSNNIEHAMNMLDELGLRQKLLSLNLRDQDKPNNANFWLNKEPLRSFEIPKGGKVTQLPKYTSGLLKTARFLPTGKTAKDLNIQVVAHETNSFLAYESITKSHTGEPNVLISRKNGKDETAVYGDGFYTQTGRKGARGTGLTIRFNVDPNAREGVDFKVHGSYIVFLNKKALRVIQESLNLGIVELVDMVESGKFNLDSSDKGIFEKLKRRLNANRIESELESLMQSENPDDQDKFEYILTSMLTNQEIKYLVADATITQVLNQIYKKLAALKDSTNENHILKYIKDISPILPELIKRQVLTKEEFQNYLSKKKGSLSPEVVSTAVIEIALSEGADQFLHYFKVKDLDRNIKNLVMEKVKSFAYSNDHRKQAVFNKLTQEKENTLKEYSNRRLEKLLNLSFVDINDVSTSGHSLLLEAAYYEARDVIDFLITNPDFNIDRKNKFGRNDIEELRLLGKTKIADYIEQKIGRTISKKIIIKERNDTKTLIYPEGTPIIDFVRIEPGTFRMGDTEKVTVTLTKAFEMMSVDTTQRMWKGVVDLIDIYFPRQFNLLKDPSSFKGNENPVENISYETITKEWLLALNQLSMLENKNIQDALVDLFPGHFLGKNYRLPTEAEWEYVSRLGGLATGDYGFDATAFNLDFHAWSVRNSEGKTRPVGRKKPVIINGKPLYDIHGNVWKWMQDSWDSISKLPGGVDPVGTTSFDHVIRGGSWNNPAQSLSSSNRAGGGPGFRSNFVGFRIVSDIP